MHAVLIAAVLLIIIGLFFFMGNDHLKTETAARADVKGTYTLLLHGCRYPDDLENIAILDREGDAYAFEIFSKDSAHTIMNGLAGEQALKEAEQFIRCSIHSERAALRRILSRDGTTIGFEVRPVYSTARFGTNPVFDTQYTIKNRTVTVHIKLDLDLEKTLRN